MICVFDHIVNGDVLKTDTFYNADKSPQPNYKSPSSVWMDHTSPLVTGWTIRADVHDSTGNRITDPVTLPGSQTQGPCQGHGPGDRVEVTDPGTCLGNDPGGCSRC